VQNYSPRGLSESDDVSFDCASKRCELNLEFELSLDSDSERARSGLGSAELNFCPSECINMCHSCALADDWRRSVQGQRPLYDHGWNAPCHWPTSTRQIASGDGGAATLRVQKRRKEKNYVQNASGLVDRVTIVH